MGAKGGGRGRACTGETSVSVRDAPMAPRCMQELGGRWACGMPKVSSLMLLTCVSTDQPGFGQRDKVCCAGASGAQVSRGSPFDSFVSRVCARSYITGPCSALHPHRSLLPQTTLAVWATLDALLLRGSGLTVGVRVNVAITVLLEPPPGSGSFSLLCCSPVWPSW